MPKLHELPNKIKDKMLPPMGHEFFIPTDQEGKSVKFKVVYRNIGQLRMSCEMLGLTEKRRIISPHSEEGRIIIT